MARRSFHGEIAYICKRCEKPTKGFVVGSDKDSTHATCPHCGWVHVDDNEFWLDVWPPNMGPDEYGYSGGTEWRGQTRTS